MWQTRLGYQKPQQGEIMNHVDQQLQKQKAGPTYWH
jgi:hypothetical protein